MIHKILSVSLAFLCFLAMGGCHENDRAFQAHVPRQHAVDQNEAAVNAVREGDLDSALEYAEEAVTDDPEYAAFYINKAIIQAHMGELEAAVATLKFCMDNTCHRNTREASQMFLLLGIFQENLKRPAEAREAYDEAIKLVELEDSIAAGESNLVVQLAIAQYLRGNTVDGLKTLNNLLAVFPENHPARMAKARLLANDRQYFIRWATAPVRLEADDDTMDNPPLPLESELSLAL